MATPKNNSVLKAFEILRLLARESRPLSVQQIAQQTGATTSTTHRFLLTLEEVGAVARRPGNLYHLGMLISELGQSARREQILTEAAKKHIDALAEALGETVTLSLFSEGGPRKVAWHEPTRLLVYRERSDFGPSLHNSSIGKLYLASLPPSACEEWLSTLTIAPITPASVRNVEELRRQIREIRATGIALSREETELGVAELSLPIASSAGEVLGAVTVSAPLARLEQAPIAKVVAATKRTIQAIVRRTFVNSYTLPGKARPRGSFPHVKRVEDLVFVSGTSSRRPDDSFAGVTIFPDGSIFHDVYAQTRESMLNIADILGSLSLTTADIVSLEAFLINMEEDGLFRRALTQAFDDKLPIVTVTAAKALPHPHQAVMVKAVASYRA